MENTLLELSRMGLDRNLAQSHLDKLTTCHIAATTRYSKVSYGFTGMVKESFLKFPNVIVLLRCSVNTQYHDINTDLSNQC